VDSRSQAPERASGVARGRVRPGDAGIVAKPLIDADALIAQFENATAQQGEQLRKAVSGATLQALQGRELTLKNIRAALKGVTDAPVPARA
jgi:hypothetical protein